MNSIKLDTLTFSSPLWHPALGRGAALEPFIGKAKEGTRIITYFWESCRVEAVLLSQCRTVPCTWIHCTIAEEGDYVYSKDAGFGIISHTAPNNFPHIQMFNKSYGRAFDGVVMPGAYLELGEIDVWPKSRLATKDAISPSILYQYLEAMTAHIEFLTSPTRESDGNDT